MTPKPGIYPGVPFEEYRSWEAINFHTLWRMRESCPAKAKYEMENGTGETDALAFGRLTDFVLLEPGRFAKEAAVEPEIGCEVDGQIVPKRPTRRQIDAKKPSYASVAAIEFWNDWDAENAGKIVVTRTDYDKVMEIERRVRTVQCKEYICGGRSQVCIVWRDEMKTPSHKPTGLLCKARLDYERNIGFNHCITDLKTARSAKDSYWRWAMLRYGYCEQLAWYHDGWLQATGETSLCTWLVAEKEPPFIIKPWEMGDKSLQAGRNLWRQDLDQWAECVQNNEWPDYGGIDIIDMDEWALRQCGVGPEIITPTVDAAVDYEVGEEEQNFAEAYDLGELT